MAVPKKRMSRTRKLLRRSQWKLQIKSQALNALSLASKQTAKKDGIDTQASTEPPSTP